ncbi:MAG: hypothetical protein ACYT04_000000101320 [Nostoc sp.]
MNFYVSIPDRDFDELQFDRVAIAPLKQRVSIPDRDFDELQCIDT